MTECSKNRFTSTNITPDLLTAIADDDEEALAIQESWKAPTWKACLTDPRLFPVVILDPADPALSNDWTVNFA